jgi:hypothetical protein
VASCPKGRGQATVRAARGYEYLAVTDHSKHVTVRRQIDKLNARLDGLVVLKSAEVDIREDGKLDLAGSVLKEPRRALQGWPSCAVCCNGHSGEGDTAADHFCTKLCRPRVSQR